MREILFRGKRADNGEWIEGYLFSTVNHTYIVYTDQYDDDLFFSPKNIFIAVDPKTVGQYTGLTDKNGKKIFEGDILKGFEYPFCCDDEFNYFAEVVWFNISPAFGIYTFKNPKSNVRGISEGNTDYLEYFDIDKWEIIGNIHDNPELLKGGDNNETPH